MRPGPGKVQVADDEPGRANEKESSNAKITHEPRELLADLGQIDFKAGKKEE